MLSAVYWEHEEYDGLGRLVARYHCYNEEEIPGERRCGWRRYDLAGCLQGAEEGLPPGTIPTE
jgi:hypothetical protein